MTQDFVWIPGVKPTTNKTAQNVRASESRAHAARVSHQRRKAAKRDSVEHVRNTFTEKSRRQKTSPTSIMDTRKLLPCQLWTLEQRDNLWLAGEDLFKDEVESEDDESESDPHTTVKASDLQLTWYSLLQREPESQSSIVFDQEYQKRSYYIWTTAFADRVAKFGVYCANVFFRIIPQRAPTSPMLRHMVLAHSFACEHWKAHPHHAHSLSVKALHHYTRALKAMYEARHDSHDFAAAIMLAFVLESRQNHHFEASQHTTGYEKAIIKYQGAQDEECRMMKGCFHTMRTYGELWALGEVFEQVPVPWSAADARETVAHIINEVEEYNKTRQESQLQHIKVELGKYLNVDLHQHKTHDMTLNQEAILLLLHVTVAILPADIVGMLSFENDLEQLSHLLSIAEAYLKQARTMKDADEKELLATLELFANTVLRNVLDDACQQRAIELLQSTISRTVDLDH